MVFVDRTCIGVVIASGKHLRLLKRKHPKEQHERVPAQKLPYQATIFASKWRLLRFGPCQAPARPNLRRPCRSPGTNSRQTLCRLRLKHCLHLHLNAGQLSAAECLLCKLRSNLSISTVAKTLHSGTPVLALYQIAQDVLR